MVAIIRGLVASRLPRGLAFPGEVGMPSAKPTPNGGAASTRQMLDELDALMERMLALPVNDLDDLAQESPRPTLSATLTVIDAPQADREGPKPAAAVSPAAPPSWAEQRLYQEPDAA